MNRILLGLAIAVLVFTSACKMRGDVLATYKGGQITRGDFYDWLDAWRQPKDEILKKKAYQKDKIQQLAADTIAAMEAVRTGYDKKEEYKQLLALMNRDYYARYFIRQLREAGQFKTDAVKIKTIRLLLKTYRIENNKRVDLNKAEFDAEVAKRTKDAEAVIRELDSGKSFDTVMKKYSEDNSKLDEGYLTKEMRDPVLTEAIFALKKGQYMKKPVLEGTGLTIAFVEDRVVLTEKNIDDLIKNEGMRNGLKARFVGKAINDMLDSLAKAPGVQYFPDKISDPNALLYKVSGVEFKAADLQNIVDLLNSRNKTVKGRQTFGENEKKQLLDRLFKNDLLRQEAIKRGIDKEKSFAKEHDAFTKSNLANFYRTDQIIDQIKVTPEEIVAEYNQTKERMAAMKDLQGARSLPPLNDDVRSQIEKSLMQRKWNLAKMKWEADLFQKYNYKLDEKKLAGE